MEQNNRILILDDDERIVYLISEILKKHNFDTIGTTRPSEARRIITTDSIDVMIVDWMMPYESGIDFIKKVRNSIEPSKNTPAIMLTALSSIDNKLEGFDSGYDDYITKPFDERELIARIKSIIKRTKSTENHQEIVRFGEYTFNRNDDKLYKYNQEIKISLNELNILKILTNTPKYTATREQISTALGGHLSLRTIDVYIHKLRKKLGGNPKSEDHIKTIRNAGYGITFVKSTTAKNQLTE